LSRKSVRTETNEIDEYDKEVLLCSMQNRTANKFYTRNCSVEEQLKRRSISLKYYQNADSKVLRLCSRSDITARCELLPDFTPKQSSTVLPQGIVQTPKELQCSRGSV